MKTLSVQPLKMQPTRLCRRKACGQNLIELTLTLGLALAIILSSVEIGRVWLTYNTTQNAALDAVITASQNNSIAAGVARLQTRLTQANIPLVSQSLVAVSNNTGYQATVTVNYMPLFGGVSLPTPGGAITIIPNKFPITFTSTPYLAVY